METIDRSVPAFVYRRMLSDFRRRLWAASEIGEMPDFDGYLPCEVWSYMGIDPACAPVASVTGESVRHACANGTMYVGAARRAAIRRDIGTRYPRLNIPDPKNIR